MNVHESPLGAPWTHELRLPKPPTHLRLRHALGLRVVLGVGQCGVEPPSTRRTLTEVVARVAAEIADAREVADAGNHHRFAEGCAPIRCKGIELARIQDADPHVVLLLRQLRRKADVVIAHAVPTAGAVHESRGAPIALNCGAVRVDVRGGGLP
eukprot:CAMPEP_0177213608 /NCGR_PEP_ID=MMETSP0367-20130122/33256_1 /TAXON_ID=447022 ORGANISM="Scrippsiella hangoei-like, Strain SHHI-4" /NCGR_SAMPLE_ID=MMETSP0367 /ASSEMBLY_ACC=CAM_ASM_000362 /LENGTH=153 /DNA_ID=CAMNT_0018662951 /DNA_START=47 /DNA_END=508 /DNA_ORIENTATION=+